MVEACAAEDRKSADKTTIDNRTRRFGRDLIVFLLEFSEFYRLHPGRSSQPASVRLALERSSAKEDVPRLVSLDLLGLAPDRVAANLSTATTLSEVSRKMISA